MTTPLVSFHGGASAGSINNVVAFPEGGEEYDLLSTATLSAVVHPLKELRKFLFDPKGQSLYVANGSKELNQVLRFSPPQEPGKQWCYEGVFASKGKGLAHPFDLVFGFEGDLFVSSQDKNWVTRYPQSGADGGCLRRASKACEVSPLAGKFCPSRLTSPQAGRFGSRPRGRWYCTGTN